MEEKEYCLHTGQLLEQDQEVYWIFDGYVLEGYEDEYCKLKYGKTYEELLTEYVFWDENYQEWIAGDYMYYTTIP